MPLKLMRINLEELINAHLFGSNTFAKYQEPLFQQSHSKVIRENAKGNPKAVDSVPTSEGHVIAYEQTWCEGEGLRTEK